MIINSIINDECLNVFHQTDGEYIEDESIDLIITSPPYKDVDGYNPILMSATFNQCYRVLNPSGLFF